MGDMKLKVRAVVVMLVVVVSATMPPSIAGASCPPPPSCGSCGGHHPPKGKPTPSPRPSPPKTKPPPGSGGSPGGKPPMVKPTPPVVKPTPPSGGYPPYTPSPPSPVTPVTPSPPSSNNCPKDALKIGACVDLLGGLVSIGIGDPAVNQCCPLLQGLAALEAAVCLCTAIRVKLLNLNVYLPLALQLLASCGQSPPAGFTCPSTT